MQRRRSAPNSSRLSSSGRIGCARPRPPVRAAPVGESSSLKDLTSRLITRDDHLLLESVADLLESADLDLRSLRRKIVLLTEEAKGKDHRSVATALVKLAACETEPTREGQVFNKSPTALKRPRYGQCESRGGAR